MTKLLTALNIRIKLRCQPAPSVSAKKQKEKTVSGRVRESDTVELSQQYKISYLAAHRATGRSGAKQKRDSKNARDYARNEPVQISAA